MNKTARLDHIGELLSRSVPENISSLPLYQPGKPLSEVERELGLSGVIKLASNESVSGPSPAALNAAKSALQTLAEYPDGGAFRLREAVASELGVAPNELIFGAGCNEVIHLAIRTRCRPGASEVLSHKFAFISYKLGTLGHGAQFKEVETTDNLGCDVDAILAGVSELTRVVFVANPNNPTGAHLPPDQLLRLVRELPEVILLVIDEAYYEYAKRAGGLYSNSLDLRGERELLLTLRTFSKIHGLAGLRVGYGVGHPMLIDMLGRTRRPFNVNAVAQAAACASLGDPGHVEAAAIFAIERRAQLSAGLKSLGLNVYPSLGNFVLVDVARDSNQVYQDMLARGVIVRPMTGWGLPTCLRISVGTEAQMQRAVKNVDDVLRS